jgi:rhamnopyranosyl-N-acetylglucosaminyl-diphospho-decaprenol beta-1,3/1,4-galactofuranosyltransferase
MSVLAHIHTWNDAAVIEQLLDALQRQTRPADAILIVDNASTDGTLDRAFSEAVTVIRNRENLGPSGAVRIGLAHALEQRFDWTWVLDADSVPEPDALEKLLAFFDYLPDIQQERVCFLNALPLTAKGEVKEQPISLAGGRMRPLPLDMARDFTECDLALWSGSLYRMSAVARIGLPSDDYVTAYGELEYGYRALQLGLISCIVHNCVIHHDVGRSPGAEQRLHRFGPIRLRLYEVSPARCYYSVRNMIYFWVYQYKPRSIAPALRGIMQSLLTTVNFALMPVSHRRHLAACMRGIRDGFTRHMERRY